MLKTQTVDLAYWIGKGDAEKGSGSPYERYLLVSLLCIGLLILYRRRFDLYGALKDNTWVMILLGYMFLSIFWSDTPFVSFKRWTRELIAVVMALVILSEIDPRKTMYSFLKRSVYLIIPLCLLIVIFFPGVGIKEFSNEIESWRGITGGKNQLGRVCLIAVLFLVWTLFRSRQGTHASVDRKQIWIDGLILGMALFLMKGPGLGKMLSLTSIITLVLGLGMFLGLQFLKKSKRTIGANNLKVVIASCIILGTASVFVGGLVVGESVTAAVGREETLTGRSKLWARLLPLAMENPLIGHGIGGFWTHDLAEQQNLNQAHNGYLDILLDYGFIGLLIFSLFLLSSCQKAHKELLNDYDWGNLWICFLVMSTIYTVAEATIDSLTNDLTAILVFLYVSSGKVPMLKETKKI
jgi:O-antigen ligase